MKSLATWKLILLSLNQDIPVMLLYVVESSGSSPGRQGFSMAVNAHAAMEGSMGGGIMEHKFVEMARAKLAAQVAEASIHKQIHNKTAATHQSGMICSGEQTILLYAVQKKDTTSVDAIVNCLKENKIGLLRLSPGGIEFEAGATGNVQTVFSLTSLNHWWYSERIGYVNHLFIIGAGHCALALSRIMCQMGFYIHLYDDRKDLKTMEENEFVQEKKMLADYEQLADLIDSGSENYVVIMTFGYRTDAVALRALINKNFKYLGLLGSRAKTRKMLDDMLTEGFDAAMLARIHAPVGIPIKSQTPEEVAVSIAAEIIMTKNLNCD